MRDLYRRTGRPARRTLRVAEYLVAIQRGNVVGCAGVRSVKDAGYLYGLVVHPDWRRRGIGSNLTRARLDRLRRGRSNTAVVLAMFWNVRFFRRLGFELVRRESLPLALQRIADLRNPVYRRSAVLWHHLDHA